jgi:hypothetical protein
MILSVPEDDAEWRRGAQSLRPRFYDSIGGKDWAEWVAGTVDSLKD